MGAHEIEQLERLATPLGVVVVGLFAALMFRRDISALIQLWIARANDDRAWARDVPKMVSAFDRNLDEWERTNALVARMADGIDALNNRVENIEGIAQRASDALARIEGRLSR